MNISIKVDGINNVIAKLNNARNIENALIRGGEIVRAEAQANCPKDTGRLANSIVVQSEVGKNTKAPYFGVAWRVTKQNGSFRLVRYYKGKYGFASPVGAKTKPSEGAAEKQTAKATFTAVARDFDDNYYYYIDTDDLPDTVTEATALEKWFTDMNWYPSAAENKEK